MGQYFDLLKKEQIFGKIFAKIAFEQKCPTWTLLIMYPLRSQLVILQSFFQLKIYTK